MANIYRSGVCMISAVICMSPRWVDTFVICLVFMHCLGSFLFKYMNSSLHEFAFEGRKHAIRLSRDILMFLATIWSSLCFSCSVYKFLPLGRSGTTWFKCSCLRPSLLTVSHVVCAIVRLRSGKTMRRKTNEDKDVIRNKNVPTVFANSFNHNRARRHKIECK